MSSRERTLLSALGISQFGDFIYLVAINVYIYRLTYSASAVAALWIISPVVSLVIKSVAGSWVDRSDLRRLLIQTDLLRAFLIGIMPFIPLSSLYIDLIALAIVKAVVEPATLTYITTLVPKDDRTSFNAYRSMITSGAFLIGPALAGGLLYVASTDIAIWLNAVSFLVSAVLLMRSPRFSASIERGMKLQDILSDWRLVYQFSKDARYVSVLYLLAMTMMIATLALDTQEVVFLQRSIGLSETDYGLLMSLTGIGSVVGSWIVARYAKTLSVRTMLTIGYTFVAIGYLLYASANSFSIVCTGFLLLGCFHAFAGNLGFLTFQQTNIPLHLMGRFTSLYGVGVSLLQILAIVTIGLLGDIWSIRSSTLLFASLLVLLTICFLGMVLLPRKQRYFTTEEVKEEQHA
ncbi:MFS transporter [Exiguobacterium sp. SL14]|nr:MFS transporter [Exiguobacterium sp. SL14]MCY1690908.1 MFS transporter [Exiguobacterium sp. SL14]